MTHGFSTEQVLDTDVTLSFDSDYIAASQRATKTFVENSLNARLSAADATDLTDGGETALHSHAGGSGGLTHPQIMARISIGF
jgi:hypothetical protein